MARIDVLWRSAELSLHRFDHPVEHEDRPYQEVADAYRASFVETGQFDLSVNGRSWRVGAGDIMMAHPDMRFHASFQGVGFNDVCLSLTYLAAADDGFDPARSWARGGRPVRRSSNHARYMRWGLQRAIELDAPMFIEYCGVSLFRRLDEPDDGAQLFSDRAFGWYAERVDAARRQIEREYAGPVTASRLAREVGMSLFHFTRVFAAMVGMPPHRFLIETRLNVARRMLREGGSVTDACYASGYGNLSHFSRSFARRYGVAPSALAA